MIICDNIVNNHNNIMNIRDNITKCHGNITICYDKYHEYRDNGVIWSGQTGILTDYVQISIPFLLIISTYYVIPTDHIHPLYHVYKQPLVEKECGTLYKL